VRLALSGRIVENDRAGFQTPTAFVGLAQQCGYEGMNLRSRQLTAETSDADFATLRQAIADAGLDVILINATVPTDAHGQRAFERLCTRSVALGCPALRVGIGDTNLADGQRACDTAAQHGLRLVTQMHTGGCMETFRLAADCIGRVDRPNYGGIVEPANHLMAGDAFSPDNLGLVADRLWMVNLQSLVVVRQAREDLSQLTLRDGTTLHYQRVPIQTNPDIDMDAVAAALRAVGYDGWINMLEPYPDVPDLAAYARDYADFLRPKLRV